MLSNKLSQAVKFEILILEDDDGHALLIEKNLRRSGLSNIICRFKTGRDLLDLLLKSDDAQDRKRILLLDLNLADISGYEVLKILKSKPQTKKMPVIILSTTDDPCEIEKCYELGCNVYLIKPIEYELFSELIQRLGFFLPTMQIPEGGSECRKS